MNYEVVEKSPTMSQAEPELPEAFELDWITAVYWMDFAMSKILYGIMGMPGIWRRVTIKDDVRGAVMARHDKRRIALVLDKNILDELARYGLRLEATSG